MIGFVVGVIVIRIFHRGHLFVGHGDVVVIIMATSEVLVDTNLIREPEFVLNDAGVGDQELDCLAL